MKKRGFTLIELIIVVAIIGILGSVVVSTCMGRSAVDGETGEVIDTPGNGF